MAVTVDNICQYIKEGRVYVGAQIPAALHSLGEAYHLGANGERGSLTAVAGEPTGGTDVGATSGETTFRYTATVETVDIEQSAYPVCPHVTEEACSLEFTVAEATAANIARAIGQGFLRDFTGPSALTGKVISVGGLTSVTGQSVCVIAEKANQPGRYLGAMIYNAHNNAGLERRWKRGEVTLVTMTFDGAATSDLLLRPEGDQLGQYFEQNA